MTSHAPETSAPVATLYLPLAKGQRSVTVYGISGTKYAFRYQETHQRPVREYASLEQFKREEMDIRRHPKPVFAVCTLLGTVGVIDGAKEAVSALIAAKMKVTHPQRVKALTEIAAAIAVALLELGETGPQVHTVSEDLTPVPAPEDGGDNFPMPEGPEEQPTPAAGERPRHYSESELMTMPWADEKLIARAYNLSIRGVSREDLTAAILSAQTTAS